MLPAVVIFSCTLVLAILLPFHSSLAHASSCLTSNDPNVTTASPCFVHQPLMTHLNPYNPDRVGVQVPPRDWAREGPPYSSRMPHTHYDNGGGHDHAALQVGGYNYPYGYSGPQPEYNQGYSRPMYPSPGRSWNPFFFRPMTPSWPPPFTRPIPPQYPPTNYPYMRPNSFLNGLFSKRTQPQVPQVYPATLTEEKPDPVYLGAGSLKLLDHRLAEITCPLSDNNYRIVSNVAWVKVTGPYEWQAPVPPFNCARPGCTYQDLHAQSDFRYQVINLGHTSILRIHMFTPSDFGIYRCAATAQLSGGLMAGKTTTVYRVTEFNLPNGK